MITKKVTVESKWDLIKLIQESQIKKIVAEDVGSSADVRGMSQVAEQLLKNRANVTIIILTT